MTTKYTLTLNEARAALVNEEPGTIIEDEGHVQWRRPNSDEEALALNGLYIVYPPAINALTPYRHCYATYSGYEIVAVYTAQSQGWPIVATETEAKAILKEQSQ